MNSQAVLIGGQPLEKVRVYKYLGILINSDLFWSDHVASVCSNARFHLGLLYRRFYKDAEAATLRVLYITHIRVRHHCLGPTPGQRLRSSGVCAEICI